MEHTIYNIISRLSDSLDTSQLILVEKIIREELAEHKKSQIKSNKQLLDGFVSSKAFESCSEKTIEQYRRENTKFIESLDKNVCDVHKTDIIKYLSDYKYKRNVSNVTINNMRRFISAFFNYLEGEDIIPCNPVRKMKALKEEKIIKEPFTELEVETLRENANHTRDKAIIDVLNSTGVRVSELCQLNISDIHNGEAIIKGKGKKERKVYFSSIAINSIKKYLSERDDNNPALFVNSRSYHGLMSRMSPYSVEKMLRNLGSNVEISKVHPHKFRRTMATRGMNKGMPIQEMQAILGHSKIDTTMIYCKVNEDNIKTSHRRYVS